PSAARSSGRTGRNSTARKWTTPACIWARPSTSEPHPRGRAGTGSSQTAIRFPDPDTRMNRMSEARYLHKLDPALAMLARAEDDLRHRPAPGRQMRDSLFWQVSLAEEKLCLQIYFFATEDGNAGCNICLWGEGIAPAVVDFHSGSIPDDCDFSAIDLAGLVVRQDIAAQRSTLSYEGARLKLSFSFAALHDAFSYHANADGLPGW